MKRMWSKNELKSIGSQQAKEVIESGQVENAKPIYWHSCTIKRVDSGELVCYVDFIIINNDETPLTKETFLQWLQPDYEIKAVQGYDGLKSSNLVSYFKKYSTNGISLKSINLSTGAEETTDFGLSGSETSIVSFTDNAPNKIN